MERPISQVSSSDDAHRPKAQSMTTKPPWQRLLWKKQPYPDNYVPDSFLDGLRTNSSIHLPPLRSIILSSLPISLQFSLILILISTFYHLRYGSLEASELLLISLSLLSIGWITLFFIQAFTLKESIDIKPLQMRFKFSYILLPLILLALSPVLRTLTEATTDDSIWALSSILFFTNWSLADYTDVKPSRLKNKSNYENDGEKIPKNLISASNPISSPSIPSRRFSFKDQPPPLSPSTSIKSSPPRPPNHLLPVPLPTGPSLPPTPPPLPSSLSLNASISASVVWPQVPRWRTKALEFSLIETVLSEKSSNVDDQQNFDPSRLPSSPLINTSAQNASNTSSPNPQKQTSSKPKSIPNLNLNLFLKVFPPLLSISISLFLLSTISKQVTFLSLMVIVFISLICPVWMKWAQRWKNEMRGPWDVGIIRVRS